jgi:Flp pilus assembly protein TadG
MRYMQKSGQRGRSCRGAAATELAIILPVLILIILGCVDFGRFVYSYIAVTNAARAGAGFGSNNIYTVGTYTTWQNQVKQAVTNEMGSISGYSSSNVTVTGVPNTGSTNPWRVEVTVPCTFQTVISWPGIPTSMTVQQKVVMRGVY